MNTPQLAQGSARWRQQLPAQKSKIIGLGEVTIGIADAKEFFAYSAQHRVRALIKEAFKQYAR